MKPNNNPDSKKKLALIISAGVFVSFILVLLLLIFIPKLGNKTNVVFYNLPDNQVKAIQNVLEQIPDDKGKKIEYVYTVADTTLPIQQQLNRKTDIIFANYGKACFDAAATVKAKKASKIFIDENILKGCTLSVYQKAGRIAVGNDTRLNVLPLFMDYSSIDYRRETNTTEQKTAHVFAGGVDAVLLDTVGALTEAIGGRELYNSLASYIISNLDNPQALADVNQLSGNYVACSYLGTLIYNGTISGEVIRMNQQDVQIYMEAGLTDMVYTTLSAHRLVPHNTIIQFGTMDFYPSLQESLEAEQKPIDQRAFVSHVISAVPLSAKKNIHKIISTLYTDSVQETLSYNTGLAPVNANCNVPDMQADDARYWIAASNPPLTPLSDMLATDEERSRVAEVLRNCISISIADHK